MSTSTTARVRTTRWKCGFCGSDNHARCVAGIANQGTILRCSCKVCKPSPRCLECGNTEPEELTGWACTDPSDCRDAIAARSAVNPLREELETVRRLGGEARRRALMERQRLEILAAVKACGIDEELGLDVAADLVPPTDRPPRKPRVSKVVEGSCHCGCEGKTRGGKWRPGHDAVRKSALRKLILSGDEGARQEMIDLGWEKFVPVAS